MSNYLEVDEAQRGRYNDGYGPYAAQFTAGDPYGQHHSQYDPPERYGHDQYDPVQHYHRPSSLVTALSQDPPASDEDNPYEERVYYTPSPRQLSQLELASRNSQVGNVSPLQRDSPYANTVIEGSYPCNADGTPPGSSIAIPQYVPRRTMHLTRGNFVRDATVPSRLLVRPALRSEREFTHMRYSAATCDPNDFESQGFTLRQTYYNPPRETELFIVITVYNESDKLLRRTLAGVIKNVANLCRRGRCTMWCKEGWKKIVVCIVADGRQKVDERALHVLAMMGVYQDGIAKSMVNGRAVTAHIYEYTTDVTGILLTLLKLEEKDSTPVQLIFCLKERNQKKINSHRWFFNAFAPVLKPNICVLLDVGTIPGPSSIYHLWKAFNIHRNVGGACGEIVTYRGKYGQHLLNPLVAAQNFEYKMSNILDKPLESVFGYITVLPGAFSAYRYKALQNDKGEGPLEKYFLGEEMHGGVKDVDIFTANMYLAEDRVLCWELVSKRNEKWSLHYVKSAYAITDVPDKVPELISQRRRWLNGSLFAAVYSIAHFHHIYRSSHSVLRKFWIHVQMLYQLFNLIFSWFALGNYYIAFVILTSALEKYVPAVRYPNLIFNYVYLGLLAMSFLLALGNRPQGAKRAYTFTLLGFGLITIYMTVSAFLLAYKGVEQVARSHGRAVQFRDFFVDSTFRNIILSLAATIGLYVISSLLSFEPFHMITSFVQYLLMAPSYITVLNVYAFANIHDVSWGTKGDSKDFKDLGTVSIVGNGMDADKVEVDTLEEKVIDAAYDRAVEALRSELLHGNNQVDPATQKEDYYRTIRTNLLLIWSLSNSLLAILVVSAIPRPGRELSPLANGYMSFILFSITGLAFIRLLGSVIYLVMRLFTGE